jgi:phosphate transport system protein
MKLFFHSELDSLKSHLVLMGEKSHSAVGKAVTALLEHDLDLAKVVTKEDDDIDSLEIEIDRESTRYLTLRAPVATDLRLITVALKASHELERIGDEARSIAKRVIRLISKGGGTGNEFAQLPEMAEKVQKLLRDSLHCLFHEDVDLAYAVIDMDAAIDRINKDHFRGFIKKVESDPQHTERYFDLILISKSLERIADHGTNLAEEVIFLLTAKEARHRGLSEAD